MTWYQIWTVAWQVAVFLTPLVLGVAVLWLKSQFVTKAEAVVERNRVDAAMTGVNAAATAESNRVNAALVAAGAASKAETNRIDGEFRRQEDERDRRWDLVKDQTSEHAGRIKALETEFSRPPTRHTLNNELTKVVAAVAGIDKQIGGLAKLHETTQEYLRTLIERELRQ